MSDPWLTEGQVQRLTGKEKPTAQAKVLDESIPPIRYTLVGGRVIVLKSDLQPMTLAPGEPQLRLVRP